MQQQIAQPPSQSAAPLARSIAMANSIPAMYGITLKADAIPSPAPPTKSPYASTFLRFAATSTKIT